MIARAMRRTLPYLIALVVIAAVPAAAAAQSIIEQQTTIVDETMGGQGLQKRTSRDGGLHQGEAMELVMDISASADVVLIGICDGDCSDLDMRVSKDGATLGEDVLDDDKPLVRLQNFGGGQLRVRVEMPGCSVAPCAFRVLVYSK